MSFFVCLFVCSAVFTDLGKLAPVQKFRDSISTRVWKDNFINFHCVICQEVMQDQLSGVSKHALSIIPVAVEAQDFAVMCQKLLQGIYSFIRPQRLHVLLHLWEGKKQYNIEVLIDIAI